MNAFNLIKADLRRLLKSKSLFVVLIIIAASALLSAAVLKIASFAMTDFSELGELDSAEMERTFGAFATSMLYISNMALGNLGFFAAIVASIFLGADYANNTIRNKLISGNSRVKVYISSLVINFIIFYVLMLATIAISSLLNLMFFGVYSTNGYLIKATLLAIPVYAAISAISTFISMSIKSNVLGIVVNLLIIVLLPTVLQFIMIIVSLSGSEFILAEYIPYSILSEIFSMDNILMMFELSGIGGLMKFNDLSVSLVLRSTLLSLGYVALFTFLGALLFRRADIK